VRPDPERQARLTSSDYAEGAGSWVLVVPCSKAESRSGQNFAKESKNQGPPGLGPPPFALAASDIWVVDSRAIARRSLFGRFARLACLSMICAKLTCSEDNVSLDLSADAAGR
jgi:hypothetical protein